MLIAYEGAIVVTFLRRSGIEGLGILMTAGCHSVEVIFVIHAKHNTSRAERLNPNKYLVIPSNY